MDVAFGDVKWGYILLFFQLVFFLDSLLDFRDAINHVLSFVDQGNAFYRLHAWMLVVQVVGSVCVYARVMPF